MYKEVTNLYNHENSVRDFSGYFETSQFPLPLRAQDVCEPKWENLASGAMWTTAQKGAFSEDVSSIDT